jgi:hypothetical protein
LINLIGGETVADLAEALQGLKLEPARGGMAKVGGLIGAPAIRALMRLEAELLLADADAWATAWTLDRTPAQRRADAFMLLGKRLAEHVSAA